MRKGPFNDPVEADVLARMGLANAIGAGLAFLTGGLTDAGHTKIYGPRYTIAFVAFMAVLMPLGALVAHHDVRALCRRGGAAGGFTPDERRLLLHVPLRQSAFSLLYWVLAAAVFGTLNYTDPHQTGVAAARVAGTIVLGGLTTAAVTFLLTERALRPVFREILESEHEAGGGIRIRTRFLLSWALGSAIPLLIIVLVFVGRSENDVQRLRVAVWSLAAVAIVAGAIVIMMAARSVSEPLEAMRAALARVHGDDLDVHVDVDDAGEVGLLQTGFNEMVAGLRDRRQLEDLFGRHVGSDVAQLARSQGIHLGGERREASVVFVDIVGSTRLAQSRPADEVVALLNTFFATVVERIEQEGGWVNKFEGDAALCVFGAPAAQPDHATRALRAARTLRRDLLALAVTHPELAAGIGVSAGDVAAGNVGAAHRYEYTVIGDPVNEAARLTEIAKERTGGVLASEEAVARATERERRRWIVADELSLRGRAQPTLAFQPDVRTTANTLAD